MSEPDFAQIREPRFRFLDDILFHKKVLESMILSNIITPVFMINPKTGESLIHRGNVEEDVYSDPGANTEWSLTVPKGWMWRIQLITLYLETDANVANRYVQLQIKNSAGNVLMKIPSTVVQVASETVLYQFYHGSHRATGRYSNTLDAPIPNDLLLEEGMVLATSTSNLQATDEFKYPMVLKETWRKP